jgi:hypothetical protein
MRRAAAALALPAAALLLAAAGSASNSATFLDSANEDPNAPDVTAVVVSNDDKSTISFKIDVSGRPTFAPGMLFDLYVDTDQNSATGAVGASTGTVGADEIIALSPNGLTVLKWTGTSFVVATTPSSFTSSYSATGPTITVSASDAGIGKAFDFYLNAFAGLGQAGTTVGRDGAPDSGAYTYVVKIAPTLTAVRLTKTPSAATHGKLFAVHLAATESDTGGPIGSGQVACTATIAGKPLPARSKRVTGGAATCTFLIPATAKGKTIRGTITVVVQGSRLTRSFVAHIA